MKAFYDVGELGWALYLSAHINWLEDKDVLVFTHRPELFRKCKTVKLPDMFFEKYGRYPADCLTRLGVSYKDMAEFFKPYLPKNYEIQTYSTYRYKEVFKNKMIFEPYEKRSELHKDAIVIFPRYRKERHFAMRNLPLKFYEGLVNELCETFPDNVILTIGTTKGAYNIETKHNNHMCLVGLTSIQDLIDICTNAKVTVGGTSAPPKISLLQGTPSFVIGHEKKRFTEEENWSRTRCGFYEIEDYNNFDFVETIDNIREFINENKCLLHN